MTLILTRGRILKAVRPPGLFWRCPMCIGFHIGWIVASVCMYVGLIFPPLTTIQTIVSVFLCGCASSAVSYFLIITVDDDGFKLGVDKSKFLR